MAKIKLELVQLRKEFGDLVAVDDVSLGVEEGETMALLGPSGCGKSTTLNMIVGLEAPTSGDILIDGKSMLATPPGQRNVGLVFQDYAVFTHMTVRQNLEYGLRVRGMSRPDMEREVAKVAAFLNLGHELDSKPMELGASQLQRVAIGRTLVTNPEILLLDEPLSNLEAEMRNQMRRELRRIQAETGQTIIYVTHDQIEALSLAHRIAVMDFGALKQYDTAHNVYHYPDNTFVGSFLGNPPMNFVRGQFGHDGNRPVVAQNGSVIPVPPSSSAGLGDGAEVIVGMRPESMLVAEAGDPEAFTASVIAVEPQGPETVLTARVGHTDLKLIVETGTQAHEGSEITIRPDAELLALFDAASGVRFRA